jgi:hypothetical protein
MKRAAATVVLALALCAASGVSVEASSLPRDARVVGVISLCGGPAPGGCFTQDATVTVFDAKGVLVASQHTFHAKFSFLLRPGSYKLQASTGGTRGHTSIVARAHRTTTARILIAVPWNL